jgi:hypothetical protein
MGTQTGTAGEDIAARVKELLDSLQHPALGPFLTDWPSVYSTREITAAPLPVLRWLAQLARHVTSLGAARLGAASFGAELVGAVCRAAPLLDWRQTYSSADLDAAFLENYGWSEIVGPVGPVPSERVACGFLILGPSTFYPRHHHAAEELYVPLSGAAAWQQGDTVWREHAPGTPIHHRSGEPHAMRTGALPLLALYVWRGADLGQKARLDAAGSPLVPKSSPATQ